MREIIFDLQRFSIKLNTAASGTVISSSEVEAGKDSLGNDITSYVKTIDSNSTGLQIAQGDGSTYSVTIQSGGSSDLANATGILSTAHGGLGSSVMSTARANLGLGSIATINSPLPVANGGTGQTLLANVVGVGSATKATQDANGNIITSAYLRKNTSDTLSGNLVVTGTGSVGSNLSVQGGIRSAGTVTMAGAASVGTSLTVAGGESVTGNFYAGAVTVTGDESIGGNATITGDLRLKGSSNYGNKLNFGDGDYAYITEPVDDQLEIVAKQISLTSSTADQVWINGTNITALGGGGDLSTATVAYADSAGYAEGWSSSTKFNGTTIVAGASRMLGGLCSTGASTVAKTVSITGYTLTAYSVICVMFSAINTAAAPTLNVNSTGAYAIKFNNTAINGAFTNTTYQPVFLQYYNSGWHIVSPPTPLMGGYCSTAAATAAKTVTIPGFVQTTNNVICVMFRYKNTATADITLAVNGGDALPIYYQNAAVTGAFTTGTYQPVFLMLYNSQWHIVDPNALVSAGDVTLGSGTTGTLPVDQGGTGTTTATPMFYGTCSTAASTVAKVVTCSGFVLTTGVQITVKFSYTSTATAPTLNVNSTGAKTIQYQGYSLVSGALRANGFYHFVYDGTYWQVVGPLVWTE